MPWTTDPEPGGSSPPKLTSLSPQQVQASLMSMEGTTNANAQLDSSIEADQGFQKLKRIYEKIDETKRRMLLQSGRDIAVYAKPYVHVYSMTHIRSSTPFRYMDLPIELRLRIAEFALASEMPLEWHWSTYRENIKVGSFERLEQAASLARTCRQLYSELSSLVWKMNVLSFDDFRFGDEYKDMMYDIRYNRNTLYDKSTCDDGFLSVCEPCQLFLSKIPTTLLKQLRRLEFNVVVPREETATTKVFETAARIFMLIPWANIKIEAANWVDLGVQQGHRQRVSSSESTSNSVERGRLIEASLSTIELSGGKRNWRVYPSTSTQVKYLEEHLEGAELQKALRWLTDGA